MPEAWPRALSMGKSSKLPTVQPINLTPLSFPPSLLFWREKGRKKQADKRKDVGFILATNPFFLRGRGVVKVSRKVPEIFLNYIKWKDSYLFFRILVGRQTNFHMLRRA